MAEAVELRLTGLDGVLDLLKSLPAEVVSKNGGPVKASLRKGALVLLREAKLNLARVTDDLDANGGQYSTGLLQKNLIASRGKAPSGGNGERYLVRVKRKSYPNRKGGGQTSTIANAQRLEYGTSQQPAEPWLRPAFHSKAEEAIRTVERELVASVDRVVRRLAKNGGR